MKIKTKIFFILLIVYQFENLLAQNFDKLGDKNAVALHGGMQFNTVAYTSIGMFPRRDPFSWYFNGNLSLSILDWTVPFSYSFSNRQGKFSQPFNQYGMSPTYKNVTLHLGYQTPSFSSYTLNGLPILGAGIEYKPKHFNFHLLYGRIKKEIVYDFGTMNEQEICFRRMASALMIGMDYEKLKIKLSGLISTDIRSSLTYIPQNARISAEDNNCASIQIIVVPIKKLQLETEIGGTQYYSQEKESKKLINEINFKNKIIPAAKIGLNYSLNNIQIGIIYERTEPNYRTHGIYFVNNDFENIQLTPRFNFLKNTLQFSCNVGLQRNNLYSYHTKSSIRRIYSIQTNWKAKKIYSISASYSNFNSFTRQIQQNPFINFLPNDDTLRFYQVSQNAQVLQNFQFDRKTSLHHFTLSYNLQEAKQAEVLTSNKSLMQNYNCSYQINHKKTKLSGGITFNYSENTTKESNMKFYGPGIQLGKNIMNGQIRVNCAAIYNRNIIQDKIEKEIIQERFGLQYSPKIKNTKFGKPVLQISAVGLQTLPNKNTFAKTEITVMSNLGWSF